MRALPPLQIGSLRACFVFPPRPLHAKTVAKARADGLRGVMVIPFATSNRFCPTVAAALLTHVQGQLDPCIIISAGPAFVRHTDELLGAKRLAIMAVDVSRASDRRFSTLSPPCPQSANLRPRLPVQSNPDYGDRHRIEAAMHRAGLGSLAGVRRACGGRAWSAAAARQWPEVSDFVARCARFSHAILAWPWVSWSRNVQKV